MDNTESEPSSSTRNTFTSLEERQIERAMGIDDDYFYPGEEDTDDNDILSSESDSDDEVDLPRGRNIEIDDQLVELKEELAETDTRLLVSTALFSRIREDIFEINGNISRKKINVFKREC